MNFPRSLFVVSTALLMVLVIGLLLFIVLRPGGAFRKADPPAVVYEIRQLSELVSVRYLVQKVVGLEEQKAPAGSEKILLIVQARVLGGIDLNTLQAGDVQARANGQWLVRLPPARILHVNIDDKETKVWDRRITWWTPWVAPDPDLERQARLKALEEIEAGARAMGILTDARHNAEGTLRALLLGFGIHNVTFASEM
jgi:Protein of unknown function (DUF4230)